MNTWLYGYLAGYVVSVVLGVGWTMAEYQGSWPRLAKEGFRGDLGFALVWNVVAQIGWPFFLPIVYCLTGFAEHGWLITRKKQEPQT